MLILFMQILRHSDMSIIRRYPCSNCNWGFTSSLKNDWTHNAQLFNELFNKLVPLRYMPLLQMWRTNGRWYPWRGRLQKLVWWFQWFQWTHILDFLTITLNFYTFNPLLLSDLILYTLRTSWGFQGESRFKITTSHHCGGEIFHRCFSQFGWT